MATSYDNSQVKGIGINVVMIPFNWEGSKNFLNYGLMHLYKQINYFKMSIRTSINWKIQNFQKNTRRNKN